MKYFIELCTEYYTGYHLGKLYPVINDSVMDEDSVAFQINPYSRHSCTGYTVDI